MKKRNYLAVTTAALMLAAAVLSGCGMQQASGSASGDTPDAVSSTESSVTEALTDSDVTVRIGSLKGPTTMGLVNLMKETADGRAKGNYTFTMETQPDILMAEMVNGNLDIALIPANMASVLYHKTDGGVSVIDINTLGVLECVTGNGDVHSVKDLSGKTVITTGQGATPEYALNYLLKENGVTDCTLEFKSEATEIAAELAKDPQQIAVLPQPFATVALMQNEDLKSAFSLTQEWDALSNGSRLLTGVTVVSRAFLKAHPDAVNTFVQEHSKSAELADSDVKGTAELVAEYGIIEKAAVAQKAIPSCNIVCITADEMKTTLEGYLRVLYEQNPKSVGGKLPGNDFYEIEQVK